LVASLHLVQGDKNVFEKMLYDSNNITELEHQMYNLWCDFYYKYVRPQFENIIIYLKCDPKVALARIKKRGRIEEQDISLDYLNQLHNYHENWLSNNEKLHVIQIDCNKVFETDIEYQNEIINFVVNRINSIRENKLQNLEPLCSIKNKIYIEKDLSDIDNQETINQQN
jgi:deoxyadenosine/deoxycytidine kinase